MRNTIITIATGVAMLVAGCASQKPVVYQLGETYNFEVLFIDGNGDTSDRCALSMQPVKRSMWGQFGLKYQYGPCAGHPAYAETTSFCDNQNEVTLHPPRMGALAFTGIVPYPTYSYPIGCIVSATGEVDIRKSTFAPAAGQTVNYEYEQRGTDTIQFNGKELECYTVQGENTSHHEAIGHYRVKYWFHPQHGFIRWQYTLPDGGRVILQML